MASRTTLVPTWVLTDNRMVHDCEAGSDVRIKAPPKGNMDGKEAVVNHSTRSARRIARGLGPAGSMQRTRTLANGSGGSKYYPTLSAHPDGWRHTFVGDMGATSTRWHEQR